MWLHVTRKALLFRQIQFKKWNNLSQATECEWHAGMTLKKIPDEWHISVVVSARSFVLRKLIKQREKSIRWYWMLMSKCDTLAKEKSSMCDVVQGVCWIFNSRHWTEDWISLFCFGGRASNVRGNFEFSSDSNKNKSLPKAFFKEIAQALF